MEGDTLPLPSLWDCKGEAASITNRNNIFSESVMEVGAHFVVCARREGTLEYTFGTLVTSSFSCYNVSSI